MFNSNNQIALQVMSVFWQLGGGPGVKPGFAASDAAVLFDYTTHPLELAPGIQPGSLR